MMSTPESRRLWRHDVHWSLYIDESGKFDNGYVPVDVAGLLIREPLPRRFPEEALRETIQAAMPEMPWPIHTAHLMSPAYFALAVHFGRSRPARDRGVRNRAAEAVGIMRGRGAPMVDAASRCIAARYPPPVDLLRKLDRELRQAPGDLGRFFEDLCATGLLLLRLVIRALAGRANTGEELGLLLVVAGESRRRAQHEPETPETPWALDPESGRYLELLEVAVERAILAVSRETTPADGRHTIRLRVLRREVATSGQPKRQPLNETHLLEVVNRVLGGLRPPVRVVTAPPEPYRTDTLHPLLVLADFAATSSRWPLDSSRPLTDIEADVLGAVGISPRSSRGPLLASEGEPREAIRERNPGVMGRKLKTWAKEQAIEWIRST